MGAELLTATLTWAGIGWLIDRWLDTAPWFLAIGALLGNAAGIYLVWLRGKRMDRIETAVQAARSDDAAEAADAATNGDA
jgi:F0F1-type ATP synthase assembly protein I